MQDGCWMVCYGCDVCFSMCIPEEQSQTGYFDFSSSGFRNVAVSAVPESFECGASKSKDSFRVRLFNNSQKERTTRSHLLHSGSCIVPWAASNAVDQRNVKVCVSRCTPQSTQESSRSARERPSTVLIFVFARPFPD